MKRVNFLTVVAVMCIFMTSCGQRQPKQQSIDNNWLGIYEYVSPEYDVGFMTVSDTYTLEITSDSCMFRGEGYQTYFGCKCTVEQTASDMLTFYFDSELYGNSDFLQTQPYLLKLSKKGDKYYFNSPYIFVVENNNIDVEAVRNGQEQSQQNQSEENSEIYAQLLAAIEANDQNSFDKLIKQVPNIDFLIQVDDEGNCYSLLGYACQYQHCDIAKKIINLKANIEIGQSNEFNAYIPADALSIAVQTGDLCSVKLLLDNGANPNRMLNEEGQTVLSSVSYLEDLDMAYNIAKLLIEKGAKVDGLGHTEGTDYVYYPLLRAVENNNIKLVQLLIDHHCNIDVQDMQGETPFTIAKRNENQQIQDLLLLSFMKKIKLSIEKGDKEWIADHIHYPISVSLNGEKKITIDNKQQLISNFEQIFYPAYIEKIKESKVDDLSTNQYGTMLGSGWIWVNDFSTDGHVDYKIYAINNGSD
jgi:ankyrin repeat protein